MANKNESGTPENQGEIVIYQTDNGDTKIDVRFVDESVWLTQQQMAELFQGGVLFPQYHYGRQRSADFPSGAEGKRRAFKQRAFHCDGA